MSVNEFQRHQIFQWYEESMGPERAAIMMDLLPPVGWGDIATKTDLLTLRVEVRGEIAELRGDMKTGLAEVRGEIVELRGEIKVGIADLGGAMEARHADVQRTLVFGMVATNATLVGLVFAAGRFT